MLVKIVFAEKSCATEIHNVVSLKIPQMLFVTPLISTKLQDKKNVLMNGQIRESLTMS